jgi:hypothetical protein
LHVWSGGWETRAGDGRRVPSPRQDAKVVDRVATPLRGPGSGRHAADPAAVRAEIDEVLAYGHDEDQWIRDLEARLARAADNVRRQRERLHGA